MPKKYDKPIESDAFWLDRLRRARRSGYIGNAIFDGVGRKRWAGINAYRKRLFSKVIKPGSTVIDIGCGYGACYPLMPNGVLYYGIDISQSLIAEAIRLFPTGNFSVCDWRTLDVPRHSYDYSILWSMKVMICDNLGDEVWDDLEAKALHLSKIVIVGEFGNGHGEHKIIYRENIDEDT